MATDQPVRAHDAEDQVKDETWARGRRKELQIAAGVAALIFAGTLYFGGLNAYLLYREAPAPFKITVSPPKGTDLPADYRVTVLWSPMDRADRALVRPQIMLRDASIPFASARPASSDPHLHTSESAELRFVVPSNSTPGMHEGQIILQKVAGVGDAQTTLASPVRIQVIGGFWTSWFLLRDWLTASVVLLALLYAFFFMLSPIPSGDLLLEYHDGVRHYRPDPFQLRPRRLALLIPWKRPALPLRFLFKKACVPPCGFVGEIVFKAREHPVLLLEPASVDRVFRAGPVAVYTQGRPLQSCGSAEVMWQECFVGFAESRSRPPYLVIRYKA